MEKDQGTGEHLIKVREISFFLFTLDLKHTVVVSTELRHTVVSLRLETHYCFCWTWHAYKASGTCAGFANTVISMQYIFSQSPLRKHAYSNIQKILPPKNENFQIKNSDIFHISAQNIDCGYSLEPPRRGGSNEYPQSMFLSRNKKSNVLPCKPQFYYIKVGFKGVKTI